MTDEEIQRWRSVIANARSRREARDRLRCTFPQLKKFRAEHMPGHAWPDTRHEPKSPKADAIAREMAKAGAPQEIIDMARAAIEADRGRRIVPPNLEELVDRCLSACGPGLQDPDDSPRTRAALRRRLPQWLTQYDLELDILPVLQTKTRKPRPNPVYDPVVFEPDIAEHQAKRLAPMMRDQFPKGGNREVTRAILQNGWTANNGIVGGLERLRRLEAELGRPATFEDVWRNSFAR